MKQTKFAIIKWTKNLKASEAKKVYEDEKGKRYIKDGSKWVCIEGTAYLETITESKAIPGMA